jgi:hypothetical protein
VNVLIAEVTGVDKERKLVQLSDNEEFISYDFLIRTGVRGSYFGHDEWAPGAGLFRNPWHEPDYHMAPPLDAGCFLSTDLCKQTVAHARSRRHLHAPDLS